MTEWLRGACEIVQGAVEPASPHFLQLGARLHKRAPHAPKPCAAHCTRWLAPPFSSEVLVLGMAQVSLFSSGPVPIPGEKMDYVKPPDMVAEMVQAGARKAALPVSDLLIRGALAGAILGIATTVAVAATVQTNLPIVGALIFPVGFVMIVLLGLDMVTGGFALLPMAQMAGKIRFADTLRNWAWVFLGNLIGSMLYAMLLWIALTMTGAAPAGAIGAKIAAIAEAKTLAHAAHGGAGWVAAFVKAMLCNWMVCLGVAMGFVAQSTISKIVAAWLPITIFFALAFEHAIVNMFVIPAGILFGAKTTLADWWWWNQVPVTLGNLAGGFLFTGLALYATYRTRAAAEPAAAPSVAPASPTVS
jgi:formate/nitrite transporter